ncbi:AraC family transcriptional regulator [Acinetobacter wuhouensis]|uniref:AraC family transcriptional regulator n=1 Tax=Acinetobacter wuhouensis TaxID=1879050 RepID=A0A4Q7AHN5_9GAMM|nr:helix-turn-helix transcriptional regulator [Acinetobacter wuhouensis]RZG45034.1 AraC family transcriptional regulator [Acinetobacter wuhouensis]RZG73708.1 AraC family transcriptional regulator [Acinetobacter wuhouensis]
MIPDIEYSHKLMIGLGSQHAYRSIIPPHTHSRAQLLYASEGAIRVYTYDHVWIVPPQCALWIPAQVEHSVVSLSEVQLSTVLIDKKAADSLGEQCFIVRISKLLRELVLRFNQLDNFHIHESTQTDEIEQALQLLIFNEIKQASTFPIVIPWPKDARLIQMCEALLETPDNPKDLNLWADYIGTSSRTLIRLFQKETGLNYRAWVQQMHIALALGKLSRGESIAKIASALGYNSSSAFSAMFKKYLGESPQHFRKD